MAEHSSNSDNRSTMTAKSSSLLAVIAIFVTAMAIFVQPLVTEAEFPHLKSIAVEIVKNLHVVAKILGALLVYCYIISSSVHKESGWLTVYYQKFLYDALELANARRFWSGLLLLVASVLMLLITIVLGAPAIGDLLSRFPKIFQFMFS